MRPGGDHRERRARCGTPAPMPIARIPVPLAGWWRGVNGMMVLGIASACRGDAPATTAVRAWLDDTTATRQSPDGTGRPPALAPMREKTAARLLDVAGQPFTNVGMASPRSDESPVPTR